MERRRNKSNMERITDDFLTDDERAAYNAIYYGTDYGPVPADEIALSVGTNVNDSDRISAIVTRIRGKLGPESIKTVRGAGYLSSKRFKEIRNGNEDAGE